MTLLGALGHEREVGSALAEHGAAAGPGPVRGLGWAEQPVFA